MASAKTRSSTTAASSAEAATATSVTTSWFKALTSSASSAKATTEAATAAVSALAPESVLEASPIDPRLRLARCDRPLVGTLPPNLTLGARVNVRVSCPGNVPWNVFVAVAVFTEGPVLVTNRPLRPGTIVSADDIRVEVRRFSGGPGCCTADPQEAVGRVLRRAVANDATLLLDMLDIAPVVRRGEMVTVLAGIPGGEVRATGVALSDARPGETLRVRHSTSLRTIQARADTQGVVRVDR